MRRPQKRSAGRRSGRADEPQCVLWAPCTCTPAARLGVRSSSPRCARSPWYAQRTYSCRCHASSARLTGWHPESLASFAGMGSRASRTCPSTRHSPTCWSRMRLGTSTRRRFQWHNTRQGADSGPLDRVGILSWKNTLFDNRLIATNASYMSCFRDTNCCFMKWRNPAFAHRCQSHMLHCPPIYPEICRPSRPAAPLPYPCSCTL